MQDVYLMNKETGEIEPSQKVIADFYKSHKWDESWADYWQETNLLVENSKIDLPDFTKAIKF
jgi:hypothetical protein